MPSQESTAAADRPDSPDPSWWPERTLTDWLRNTLAVSGPTEEVARFSAAAAGAGVIPWQLDLAALEEEFLLPMAAPPDGVPAISLAGAKLLARRLREAAALNHQRALSRLDTDKNCPLDLHRLLPVPSAILKLGPEEAASRDWLASHWGTTRPPRHVEVLPGKLTDAGRRCPSSGWASGRRTGRPGRRCCGCGGTGRRSPSCSPPTTPKAGRKGRGRAPRRGATLTSGRPLR